MTTKKAAAPTIETINGKVPVDAGAYYRLNLAKAVNYLGHVMRPSDRNVEVSGEVLLAIAASAGEGAIVDATLRA